MMRRAALCCRPALLRQLEHIPTETPVLAMGKWAAFALVGKDKGVMNARGFIRWDFEIPRGSVPIEEVEELLHGEEPPDDE